MTFNFITFELSIRVPKKILFLTTLCVLINDKHVVKKIYILTTFNLLLFNVALNKTYLYFQISKQALGNLINT